MAGLSNQTGERIALVLRGMLRSSRPLPAGFRALAREASVLPVVEGSIECHGIRTDAEVVRWDARPDVGAADVSIEPDARRRRWVLFQASRRFPELADLAPRRPPNAVDCIRCEGTGRDPELHAHADDPSDDCLRCGGVGWALLAEIVEPGRFHGRE